MILIISLCIYIFRTKLYQMCKCSEVQDFIRKVDYTFYQNLVEVLMPNVLRPIPSEFHRSILSSYDRNFICRVNSLLMILQVR